MANLKKSFELTKIFIDLADDILSKITAIAVYNDDEFLFKLVVRFFFVKAYRTINSIFLLCQHNYVEDAVALLRNLFEIVVNTLYISKDPLQRARVFLEYDHVQKRMLLVTLQKANDPWSAKVLLGTVPEKVKEIEEQYERVKDNYKNLYRWSGKTIRKMAQDVGLNWHYDFAYWLWSNLAHVSPRAVDEYLKVNKRGINVAMPSDEDISRVLKSSCVYFLMIMDKMNKVYALGFDEKIKKMEQEIQKIAKSDPS